MDQNRFDAIARNLAHTTDRRSLARGAAGGGLLSALGLLFGQKTLAADATKPVECTWEIEAHGSVGPNQTQSWNGILDVTIDPDGDINKGFYTLVDSSWNPLKDSHGNVIRFDVVGTSNLRSIDFRTERDGCIELDFTGVNRFHVRDCQGPMSGSFHGPELVDLGGWRTRQDIVCQACRGMVCPPGQHLDSVACVCSPTCPGGYKDCGENVCVPPACPKGTVYDPVTCACGCEKQTCKPTEVWCPLVCKCLPPKPCLGLKCPPGYVHELVDEGICICVKEPCKKPPKCKSDEILIYDGETCRCVPTHGCIQNVLCDTNHKWNPDTCSCECIQTVCPSGQTFDPQSCQCVSGPCVAPACPNDNYVVDANCNCVCPETFGCLAPLTPNTDTCTCGCVEQTCDGNFKWNPDKCACVCPAITCDRGTTLNTDTCTCDQNPCQPQQCPGRALWNPDKCACECGLTCPRGTTLDPAACECNQNNPCATAPTCPDGTTQDPTTCQCICPTGAPLCGAGCSTKTNTANCGTCGNTCEFGCDNGQCIPG